MLRLLCLALAALLPALQARADAPQVAADIAPVHSLVAQVMAGIGAPDLLLRPGASPHGHALRPSDAAALERAALVVRIGPALTPWLDRPIRALAGKARTLNLLEVPGTITHRARGLAQFGPTGDGNGGDGQDHDHDNETAIDPHAWLDPQNGQLWLTAIAGELARIDPANAEVYTANAAEARARLATVTQELTDGLRPLRDVPYVVFHDAYRYFEVRFGLSPVGAIRLSDAADPAPAHLARLRARLGETGLRCVFTEPQFNPGLAQAVIEGSDASVAVLDPMGGHLQPGPDLYVSLLTDLANAMRTCLH